MSDERVHELFSRAAAEFSSQTAIECASRSATYYELETQSNRLANFLLEHGVSRSVMVGLFTSDPIQIITAILGVLKAGGVFVPLDPGFPDQRLRVMSDQVKPDWYLVQGEQLERLARLCGKPASDQTLSKVVCLDAHASTPAVNLPVLDSYNHYDRIERPSISRDPDAPCSVYFTSGSTGKPKPILGRLKGIDHFIRWEIEAVAAKAGTRVSQLTSPSFDGFLKDAFMPLCAGGVVCVPNAGVILDAWKLADWLDVEQIHVLHCVPSVFRSLINEELSSNYFEAMKCVVLTGEPLFPADVKRWLNVFGNRIRLLNIYGTTETTLSKFYYEVKPEDVERPSIPVGKPIAGASLLIVNSDGEQCGLGAVGEVYIQTPYRSLGYYGEPELTRKVFIQNPFSNDVTDVVYKTGDYGRRLKGGDLELLGRRDQQVQVRGVRVELGEIENLLRSHDAVREAAVIDRDDAQGNKFLVAYVAMNNGAGHECLQQYLAERLPEAMRPSAVMELDQLPRTLNGKIDRKALPVLEIMQAEQELGEAGPRSPVEEIVAGIWCQVLRLPAVGRKTNFFNLGGHSLLVTKVLARIREHFKVELPIRSLFETPTIEEFSQLVEEQIRAGRQAELRTIERVAREGELPLSLSQQRMWFFEQLARGSGAFNIALGMRLRGPLNVAALEQTCSEIMRRHESLRTIFPAVHSRPVQIIQSPVNAQLPLVDLTQLPYEEREQQATRLTDEETVRRFDLTKGPLLRLLLLRMDHETHLIVCTMHHIIGDGQSFEVMKAEMSRLYATFGQGHPSPLPELKVQYVDYAAWQREWLQGEVLETRLGYWKKRLADSSRRLSLPQRKAHPAVQAFRGARQALQLTGALTKELKELSQREGVTLPMTMLAAFVLLLNEYTGDEDIVVGTVSANRDRPESENLIGLLANPLILRVDVSGEVSFREMMKRVREVCLDAYNFQLPPEILRETFNDRTVDGDRLFDVWFQLERGEREQLEIAGLECELYERREQPRFELSLMLAEYEDEIRGVLEYDVELFAHDAITEMVQSYVSLLEQMVNDPDSRSW